jgi:hypothetical protein
LNDGPTSSIIAQQRRHGRATCLTSDQRIRNPHWHGASCISRASIAAATRQIQHRSTARPMNPRSASTSSPRGMSSRLFSA